MPDFYAIFIQPAAGKLPVARFDNTYFVSSDLREQHALLSQMMTLPDLRISCTAGSAVRIHLHIRVHNECCLQSRKLGFHHIPQARRLYLCNLVIGIT